MNKTEKPSVQQLQKSIDRLMELHAAAEILCLDCWRAMDWVGDNCEGLSFDPCLVLHEAHPSVTKAIEAILNTADLLRREVVLRGAGTESPTEYIETK